MSRFLGCKRHGDLSNAKIYKRFHKIEENGKVDKIDLIQGVQTLSVISNFDIRVRKTGQTSIVRVFSWSLMMHNLF